MIKICKPYFSSSDTRGELIGLFNCEKWKEVNLISSKSRVYRGGHYHKRTNEGFILISGSIQVEVQKVKNGKLIGEIEVYNFKKGDFFIIEKFIYHKFYIKTNSVWINLLNNIMDVSLPDINLINE